MIEIQVEVKALAEVDKGLDRWLEYFRTNPKTTPDLAQYLVNPRNGMSEKKNTAMLALMLATAIQRLVAE